MPTKKVQHQSRKKSYPINSLMRKSGNHSSEIVGASANAPFNWLQCKLGFDESYKLGSKIFYTYEFLMS